MKQIYILALQRYANNPWQSSFNVWPFKCQISCDAVHFYCFTKLNLAISSNQILVALATDCFLFVSFFFFFDVLHGIVQNISHVFLSTGGKRFYEDMENMLGFRINPWIRWCWAFLTPAFCLVSTPVVQYSNQLVMSKASWVLIKRKVVIA